MLFFHRIMRSVLSQTAGTSYADDVLIAYGTEVEHDQALHKVMGCLQVHGLHLWVEKIKLGQKKVTFLGYDLASSTYSMEQNSIIILSHTTLLWSI